MPGSISDLSAAVTSPQSNASLNCSDDVFARVVFVNKRGSDVSVRVILKTSGVTAGGCFGDYDFRTELAPLSLPTTGARVRGWHRP